MQKVGSMKFVGNRGGRPVVGIVFENMAYGEGYILTPDMCSYLMNMIGFPDENNWWQEIERSGEDSIYITVSKSRKAINITKNLFSDKKEFLGCVYVENVRKLLQGQKIKTTDIVKFD